MGNLYFIYKTRFARFEGERKKKVVHQQREDGSTIEPPTKTKTSRTQRGSGRRGNENDQNEQQHRSA